MASSKHSARQLGRILRSSSSGSPDEQSAGPNEGSYGELMDEIDRLVGDARTTEPNRAER